MSDATKKGDAEEEIRVTIDKSRLTWGDYEMFASGRKRTADETFDFVRRVVVKPDWRTLKIAEFQKVVDALNDNELANPANLP